MSSKQDAWHIYIYIQAVVWTIGNTRNCWPGCRGSTVKGIKTPPRVNAWDGSCICSRYLVLIPPTYTHTQYLLLVYLFPLSHPTQELELDTTLDIFFLCDTLWKFYNSERNLSVLDLPSVIKSIPACDTHTHTHTHIYIGRLLQRITIVYICL